MEINNQRLAAWIHKYSVALLASELGVTRHAVRYWLRGQCRPSIETAMQIVELSKGKLKLTDVLFTRYAPPRKKG